MGWALGTLCLAAVGLCMCMLSGAPAVTVTLPLTGIGAAALPSIWLDAAIRRRRRWLESRLADLADRIGTLLAAGLTVPAAFAEAVQIERCAGTSPDWLLRELQRSAALLELSVVDLSASLAELGRRIPTPMLASLIGQLSAAAGSGGRASEALCVFARGQREQLTHRRLMRLGGLPVRLIPAVALPVVMFLFLLIVACMEMFGRVFTMSAGGSWT